MTNLDHALQGIQRLGVDTAPVIYFIEASAGRSSDPCRAAAELDGRDDRVLHPRPRAG
jgi:hypothetical protein